MVLNTAMGISLAVRQHFFYHNLAGNEPPSNRYGILGRSGNVLTQQQINLATGAAFALLVKTFLGIASSVAHDQLT